MTDEDCLLAGVLAAPDDDLPRLVYADWLDEHDRGPQAEFIRVQVELAMCEAGDRDGCSWGGTCDCRGHRLTRRERELWNVYRLNGAPHLWFGVGGRVGGVRANAHHLSSLDVPQVNVAFGGPRVTLRLVRGFIGIVRGPLDAFWNERMCDQCGGFGTAPAPPGYVYIGPTCNHCNHTGRVSGPAPAFAELVRLEPVTRADVSDLAPSETPSGWAWWRHTGLNDTDTLPAALFDRLAAVPGPLLFPRERVAYATAADATAALSAVLLSAARSRGGFGGITQR